MGEDRSTSWLDDLLWSRRVVYRWLLALVFPVLAGTELTKGNVWMAAGLAGLAVMFWAEIIRSLEWGGERLARIGIVCGIVGGLILLADQVRWWIAYLR